MKTTVARTRRTSRFGTAAIRKSWISSVITSSASENQERTAKIQVDVNRRYLDEFRAVRSRATRVEDTLQGLRAHYFDDPSIPFVRVDDNVGDQTDPANFTRIFRIAYYRDGTVRKYIITFR